MMEKLKIYCYNTSELAELEASNKGHRSDIFVSINNSFFQLYVYDKIRLIQDFETEFEYHGFYEIEPNIVIVNEVILKEIKFTLEKLHKQKYFEMIKSQDIDEIQQSQLIEI